MDKQQKNGKILIANRKNYISSISRSPLCANCVVSQCNGREHKISCPFRNDVNVGSFISLHIFLDKIGIMFEINWIFGMLFYFFLIFDPVYPNQPQQANYMMNHMPMQQQQPPHIQHTAQPHFYQVVNLICPIFHKIDTVKAKLLIPFVFFFFSFFGIQNPIGAAVPQMQPMYYAAASSPYPTHAQMPPQQHFMVGPPPAYSNTTAPQYPTGYCPPPAYQAPIFHNVNVTAAPAQVPPNGYKVPMSAGPQVRFYLSVFFSSLVLASKLLASCLLIFQPFKKSTHIIKFKNFRFQ